MVHFKQHGSTPITDQHPHVPIVQGYTQRALDCHPCPILPSSIKSVGLAIVDTTFTTLLSFQAVATMLQCWRWPRSNRLASSLISVGYGLQLVCMVPHAIFQKLWKQAYWWKIIQVAMVPLNYSAMQLEHNRFPQSHLSITTTCSRVDNEIRHVPTHSKSLPLPTPWNHTWLALGAHTASWMNDLWTGSWFRWSSVHSWSSTLLEISA